VWLFDDQTDPREAQVHANARLTERGRMILVERIAAGRPIAHVAAEMGIARKTATKWWRRWLAEGAAGLADRSSRPRHCPHRTPARLERQIIGLRQKRKLGPARISSIVGVPTSTVHRVLCRHQLNRLAWMDRPTGQIIRRIHTDRPGQLVHVDVKQLGRIPPGGGWKALGRGNTRQHHTKTRVGYDYVHSAVDAYSRLAYSEILDDERGPSCAAFWERAEAFFADHTITVEAVLTGGSGSDDPRPTARSNASTGPCSTNGPTPASTPPTASATGPLTAGYTSTTITAATPPSEAKRPSPGPTSRDNTASPDDSEQTERAPAHCRGPFAFRRSRPAGRRLSRGRRRSGSAG
jgi:hypothetical protein